MPLRITLPICVFVFFQSNAPCWKTLVIVFVRKLCLFCTTFVEVELTMWGDVLTYFFSLLVIFFSGCFLVVVIKVNRCYIATKLFPAYFILSFIAFIEQFWSRANFMILCLSFDSGKYISVSRVSSCPRIVRASFLLLSFCLIVFFFSKHRHEWFVTSTRSNFNLTKR